MFAAQHQDSIGVHVHRISIVPLPRVYVCMICMCMCVCVCVCVCSNIQKVCVHHRCNHFRFLAHIHMYVR